MSNVELLKQFEIYCFKVANYPNNSTYNKKLAQLEKKLAKCLGISEEEYESIREGE